MKKKYLFLILALLQFVIVSPVLAAPVDLANEYPLAGQNFNSLGRAIHWVIDPAFAVATVIVALYFAYAAFRWIASGGNKEEVAKARAMITHSVIGFLLLMGMFLVVQFIPEAFNLYGFKIF